MPKILIVYGSSEGQTEKVARRVMGVMRDNGHDAEIMHAEKPERSLNEFDAFVVGASIHMGKHQKYVTNFVKQNLDSLTSKPSAFFSVSLSAADEEKRHEAEGYVEDFIEETGWKPDLVRILAGALRYSEYGLIKRYMMKKIAKEAGKNPSHDCEYTEWEDVEKFAEDFAASLEIDQIPQ